MDLTLTWTTTAAWGGSRGSGGLTADDADLVGRARAGDQIAFARLFEQYHAPILNYLHRMVGDRAVAEDLTQADGKTIIVGVPKKGDNITIYSLPLHFKKVLKGSHGGGTKPDVDIPRYLRLMEAGKLSLDGIVTHELKLEQINEAIEIVRSGDAGRVLIAM